MAATLDNGYKYAYLVCVDGSSNANKFYEMEQVSPGEFMAYYGREGVTRTPKRYSMYKWDSVYRNRVKSSKKPRPYTDITKLKLEAKSAGGGDDYGSELDGISDPDVRDLLSKLQSYATNSVRSNYEIAASAVTGAMVDRAQSILNQVSGLVYTPDTSASNRDINELLEELYVVIPRAMRRVSEHLLRPSSTLDIEDAKQLFNLEQANLDVMAQEVRASARKKAPATTGVVTSLLESMGIEMRPASPTEARFVKELTQGETHRIKSVYAVTNKSTQAAFDSQMAEFTSRHGAISERLRTATYWHGSRNENWMSILDSGLLVRPPGAHTTGSMFGVGIYFADKFSKSYNYTSRPGAYYVHGNANHGVMALFQVRVGRQYTIKRWHDSHYDLTPAGLEKLGGYDSVWGKSGQSLLNNEYVVYSPSQCTIAYLALVV